MPIVFPTQIVLALLVVFSLKAVPAVETESSGPIANTTCGLVMGTRPVLPFLDGNITTYLGIPYAEPPTEDRRFTKPVPKKPWQGVLNAVAYGPMCPQVTSDPTDIMDEACLYLNIFIPDDAVRIHGPLPVMVWIHGGSFTSGKGDTYLGFMLAIQGGVVVVNLNYRLGLLGFLSTGDDAAPGNYGLWDQKLAIEWVKDNIGNFGGDPQQITIFGESAGGISVSFQAISPANNRNLFQRVIAQSGAADDTVVLRSDACRANAAKAGSLLGCDDIQAGYEFVDCLREVPAQSFVDIQAELGLFGPCLDGEFLPDYADNLLNSPHFGQYDLLLGVNSDDGSYFAINPDGINSATLRAQVTNFFSTSCRCGNIETLSDAALFFYTKGALDDTKANQKSLMVFGGDALFYVPTVNYLHSHYKASESSQYGTKTYFYYFPMAHFRDDFIPPGFEEYIDGAPHAADLPYVFGLVTILPFQPDAAKNLSLQMMTYWTNFAKTGDPNSNGLPVWPKWDPNNEEYIILDATISTDQHLVQDRMSFFRDYIPELTEVTDPNTCSLNAPKRSIVPQTDGAVQVDIKAEDGHIFGTVIGSLKKADGAMGGHDVGEFLGIPYAKPPVGALRFQPSQEMSALPDDPLELTVKPPACPQVLGNDPWMMGTGLNETNEDCLTVNVYAPSTPSSDPNMPVMVYIHHGYGLYGTASAYDATTLSSMLEAVVVVVNYRLGALGFLSTENKDAPGNAGLHDIITALQWINKYIGSFQGDPRRVTVTGYGIGASFVHLLSVSEKTKGLFDRVVLMSGSAFTPMVNNPQMDPLAQAATVAEKVSCPTDGRAMLDCLQEIPVEKVVANTPRDDLSFSMAFPPVVDGDILTDTPTNLIKAGKVNDVDFIIGITQSQTDGIVASLLGDDWERCPNKTEVQGLIEFVIGKLFQNKQDLISLAAMSEYLEGHEHNPSPCLDRQRLNRFMLDVLAAVPCTQAARYHSNTNNDVYMYTFDQEPKYHYNPLPSWTGPALGDDLQYLFGFPYWPMASYPLTENPAYRMSDRKTSLEWTTMLSNFINDGYPGESLSGVEWPRYSALNANHLALDSCPEVQSNLVEHTYRFWNEVIPSLDVSPDAPSMKPTQHPTPEPYIDGGLGLKLSPDEANMLIKALFGTSICLVVLCLASAVVIIMQRLKTKKAPDHAYPESGDNVYDNPSKIEIKSL
ncbi:uncharacterized protein LOC119729267 [Patiria miniata]|uniref:Carboxylesterase type B domain-containing protein n=1 Tax=Patiria miniata TaxID=46514 RepID=A0A914A1S2_PATMI|nr:uncharacterized protein LOC119729267 [Patiria miniata]